MNFFDQLSQMPLKDILALGLIGSTITTIGSLMAVPLKEFFFARSFEKWKSKRSLESVYQKYRDPIVLAARELCSILNQICKDYPPNFLDPELLVIPQPERQLSNDTDDPYYRKYKLVSSVYRLCAFLGWLELYRQDLVFLNSGRNKLNRDLELCLHEIRNDLAGGELNQAEDWEEWKDALLFREEQRAIGETMIQLDGNAKVVIGYGRFCGLFDSSSERKQHYWIRVATNFFLYPGSEQKDFRLIRMKRLIVHLVNLIELLDRSRLSENLIEWKEKYAIESRPTDVKYLPSA